MKKIVVMCMTLAGFAVMLSSAFAVPPGRFAGYAGGGAGKVVFDSKTHADAGLRCADCHIKIFPMKSSKPHEYTMATMNAGKNCGTCHNGKLVDQSGRVIFSTADAGNCSKCHKK